MAFTGTLLYSHILPGILAAIGIFLICNGIMDRKNNYTIIGVALFFIAAAIPFLILPFML
jgi:hypothetical protein